MSESNDKSGRNRFPHIFEERKVGSFTSRNRVKYAACSVSNFNHFDGSVSERELARMGVIARTGCGIITNQGVYPDPRGEGKAYYRMLALYDDRYIEGIEKVCKMIHAHGAIAIQQVLHGGRYGGIDLDYCLQPSAVKQSLRHFREPREITVKEIDRTIKDHAEAARRSIQAGYDGVEITAFMGYLIANFLSSYTNKRTDEYGGNVENRARFMVEMLQAIRGEIGSDKLLIVRLNAVELMDEYGGSTPDECIEFMKIAEKDAGVDMISIVIGWHEARTGALGRDLPSDNWVEHAKRVKEAVTTIPVAFGVRLRDPFIAEQCLKDELFDFWEVCRPFLADPKLLHKLEEDRPEEIKPCQAGLTCLARMFNNLPYLCTVNPVLGHEAEPTYQILPARLKKKVLVVGGGPSGLEVATVAAQRGHEVVVHEQGPALGGQLLMANREPSKGKSYEGLIGHYEALMKKHGVKWHVDSTVDAALIRKERPDLVVLATGASFGRFNGAPAEGMTVVSLGEALIEDKVPAGSRVVILSGERAGLVTAEYLASEKGCSVSLIEEGPRLGGDVEITFIWRHMAWIRDMGVNALKKHRLKSVNNGHVIVTDAEGNEVKIAADILIQAGPRRPRQELEGEFKALADELYLVGDAIKPRSLTDAIHEGYKLGVRI
jgi:2,4-dienoyl-CoA reductase-like NADH-dependent reductase (Old Yellow Enzyme family)/thioredoxin reductase